MVLKEFLGLANLAKAQIFYIHKLMGVFMINKDKDLIFIAFQIMTSSLQGFNNRHKFLIMNLVPNLGVDHLLREKSY